MVSNTFEHLADDKQLRIRQALLHEFSTYPLAQAQVARIVADAGIARGAFYKYFSDLTDAYHYVLNIALYEIHKSMPTVPTTDNVETYIESIKRFVQETDKTGYRDLIELHYRYNEGFLGNEPSKMFFGDKSANQWAITLLYHQTIKDIILDPGTISERLAQLRFVLTRN
ncbi:TetR/AcrR family transcriptional regulator [Weissella hellenica]|nr:TetR/AcrR family transcriptional regulator [Weissella hellenica]